MTAISAICVELTKYGKKIAFICAVVLAAASSVWAVDQVTFTNVRGPDGMLDAQGKQHQFAYLNWDIFDKNEAVPVKNGRIGLADRGDMTGELLLSLHVGPPGEYRLTFKKLWVHSANEGGRKLAVSLSGEKTPRAIISQLLPDGDSMEPMDFTLPLTIGPKDIKDGRVKLLLRGASVGACYLSGASLAGSGSKDEIDFSKLAGASVCYHARAAEDYRYEPWNFGTNGVGVGYAAVRRGYVRFSLKTAGVGPHRLTLRGIQIPAGVLLGVPVLKVNGQGMIPDGKGESSIVLDVSEEQAEAGVMEVRIEPVLEEVVFVTSASLAPADEMKAVMDISKVNQCVVWSMPVYGGFRPSMRPTMPPEEALTLDGARNEWVSACWMAGNYFRDSKEPLPVEAILSDLKGPDGSVLPGTAFKICVLEQMKNWSMPGQIMVWCGLKHVNRVEIPPREARQMWLVGRISKQTRPGIYRGTVRVSWKGGEEKLAVSLRVYDFELPDEAPIAICGWNNSGLGPYSPFAARVLRESHEHYGNTVVLNSRRYDGVVGGAYDAAGNFVESPDFSALVDTLIELRRFGMRYILHEDYSSVNGRFSLLSRDKAGELPRLAPDSEPFRKAARVYFSTLAEAYTKAGFDSDHWFLYPFDEYLGPKFVKAGVLYRASNPAMHIFGNKCDDLGEMKAAAPYVDLWCPHVSHLDDPGGVRTLFLQDSGKPIWFYTCSADRGMPALGHRRDGWFAFRHHLQGIGTWEWMGCDGMTGAPWEAGEDETDTISILSPRALAWTDGIEDYMYLHLLERRAAQAGKDQNVDEARRISENAVTAVLTNAGNPEVYAAWHRTLGETIERLSSRTAVVTSESHEISMWRQILDKTVKWLSPCAAAATSAGDKVVFTNARDADGRLNKQAIEHEVEYYTWEGVTSTFGRGGAIGLQMGCTQFTVEREQVSFEIRAAKAGEYNLLLRKLVVHPSNEGGRVLAVYVGRETSPRIVIDHRPEGDTTEPKDYSAKLSLGADDIRGERVLLCLRGYKWANCYVSSLKLTGADSSDEMDFAKLVNPEGRLTPDAIARRLRFYNCPCSDARPESWNLRERGAVLDSSSIHGYVEFVLRPAGVGAHCLRLDGIVAPKDTAPDAILFNVNGHPVSLDKIKNGLFEMELDVSRKQAENQGIRFRLEPVSNMVVSVGSASLSKIRR